MRFLQNMDEDDNRTEERSLAVKRLESGLGVVGGGEGGDEGNLDTAAEAAVPTVVEKPRPCTYQEVGDITPDQAQAAAARGSLTAP